MKKTPASVYTALRIPGDLRQRAQRRAKALDRTLSGYIKHLIKADLGLTVQEDSPAYRVKRRTRAKR